MPTIRLSDALGADVDVQLAEGSDLRRYLAPLPALLADGANLAHANGLTLAEPAVRALSTGLAFGSPTQIGDGAAELAVKAGVSGTFRVRSRHAGAENLFGSGALDQPIEIPEGTCYAATGIVAETRANMAAPVGAFQFGAEPGATIEVTNYRPWPESTTLLEALTGGLQTFVFPTSLAALDGITSRGVLTVATRGSLRVSASAELLAAVNPLASLNIPSGLPVPAAKAGGSVQAAAAYIITGEYEIRAHRLPSAHFHLGWYRRSEQEFEVSATASAGVSIGGGVDLLGTLMRVVSGSPKVDRAELAAAGLSAGQIEGLAEAVKTSVSRRLELSAAAQVNALRSGEAAFLYEVDPAALTPEGRAAIDQALRCDLSLLHGAAPLAGITCLKTVVAHERSTRLRLPVNFLGLAGASLTETLARGGKILTEPATGALVIADEVSASRLALQHVSFGADAQKLRKLSSESLLASVAFRGLEHAIGAPELEATQSWVQLDNETSATEMARALRAGRALGLLDEEAARLPKGIAKFTRTQAHIEVRYSGAVALGLFLDAHSQPHPRAYYEAAGRRALEAIIALNDTDHARLRLAHDDVLWQQVKQLGPAADLGPLLPGVPEPIERAIAADYATIAWWAAAMAGAAEPLARLQQLTRNGVDSHDAAFTALREQLARHLQSAASHTRSEFGQPWGLLALFEASGRLAPASITIAGPHLNRHAERG
jgi:hypothetical protein